MPSLHPAQDGDNESPQKHNDTQGSARTPDHPVDDSRPLDINENSTAYSLPRWRKLLHSVFGMQQCGFQVGGKCCLVALVAYIIESKGNDTFDYEQKFPDAKWCEELGPLARVWRTYLEVCGTFDIEMLEGWSDGLDVLLVFVSMTFNSYYFLTHSCIGWSFLCCGYYICCSNITEPSS